MSANDPHPQIYASGWFAHHLGASVRAVHLRSGRAVEFLSFARNQDVVVMHARQRGLRLFLLRELLRGRRRVVLIEFIRERPQAVGRRILERGFGFILRRTVRRFHVLTRAEVERYEKRYGLNPGTVRLVEWPLHDDRESRHQLEDDRSQRFPFKVVSSGRAACDWETLFEAARRAAVKWDLTVICSRADEAAVRRLNDVGATILVDVPADTHRRHVEAASVFALSLRETESSSGHIRLMTALDSGTPVVATNVSGLDGYIDDGTTALVVPPDDPTSLAEAVDRVLRDPDFGRAFAECARASVVDRSFSRYILALADLVKD